MVVHMIILGIFGIWYYLVCMEQNLQNNKLSYVLQRKPILVIMMISIGMCFFVNFLLPIISPFIPERIAQEYNALMEEAGFGLRIIPVITSIFIAPFGEEFMFRGVVFWYLLKWLKDGRNEKKAFIIANLLQAFLFGVFHMNLIQGTYAMVIGITLGYLAYLYKSVIPAIIAHMTNNILSTFAWGPITKQLPENNILYGVCAFVALLLAIAGILWGGRVEKEPKQIR